MELFTFLSRRAIAAGLAVLLLCGAFGLLAPQPALAAKAPDKPAAAIGYVSRQRVIDAYPGIRDVMAQIQKLRAEAQQDYDTNAKDLPEADKKAYGDKLSRQQAQREQELLKPVGDKIDAAIKAVADAKGLAVILDAAAVVQGGTDITADVIAKVQ